MKLLKADNSVHDDRLLDEMEDETGWIVEESFEDMMPEEMTLYPLQI